MLLYGKVPIGGVLNRLGNSVYFPSEIPHFIVGNRHQLAAALAQLRSLDATATKAA